MVENDIVALPFDREGFANALTSAAGTEDAPVVAQVAYIARYAAWLGAKTIVREDHYVDRHFVDEHALYYSRNLRLPPNSVKRFHLFSRDVSNDELGAIFEKRASLFGRHADEFERDLSSSYLGFVSIRPIYAAPIGRTVLRRLDDGVLRDMWATGENVAHLANLRLSVDGLAFQQQDLAVGACATAAVWSALSVVARREGMRSPTPAEVSQAASRHILPYGRALPAMAGLSVQQLCEAIRGFGFAPEVQRADLDIALFVVALHTYLRSGIPVVLVLQGEQGHHAVTALGFQLATDPVSELTTAIPVRSARIWKLYVHDDGLGPYARAFLFPIEPTQKTQSALILGIEGDRLDRDVQPKFDELEAWRIESAIAPVYPKLRLPARSLITLAELAGDLMEDVVGEDVAPRLSVEMYYERSGRYLGQLGGRVGPGAADFMRRVTLPRWCGIVRWLIDENPIAEFVYDTTDILRDADILGARELIRAIVCLEPAYKANLMNVAKVYRTLCL